ncbi:MAG TPA: amidohydrolase family protein [Longimicrobiales bacterium]|nr:amidohydrolase family protein [Longimicrobiales bacterium]
MLAGLLPGPLLAQGVTTDSALALTGVGVVDGASEAVRGNQTVWIVGGTIRDVFETGTRDLPSGTPTIDLSGRYVIPGLIDGHQHFSQASPGARLDRLRFLLEGGVTAVRDPSGDARILGYLALQARTGEIPAPDIVHAALIGGPGFGDYGPVAGISEGYTTGLAPWVREVGDTTDLSRVMIEARAVGARGVKLYRYLSPDLTRRVADAARAEGLLVWSHARIRGHNGSDEWATPPAEVVRAGVDVVSHAGHLACQVAPCRSGEERSRAVATVSPDHPAIQAVLRDMAERGTILDATLVNSAVVNEEAYWLQFAAGVTGLAARMGVPIMAGPDIPDDPERQSFPLLHRELELLVTEAGLSPWEALVAATSTAARGLGEEKRRGMIRPGMRADLVVLDADPLVDIRALRDPRIVIKGGRIVFGVR